jgi:hypothetical protein
MNIPLSGGLNLNTINNSIGSALQAKETQFTSTMSTIESKGSDSVSQFDLLAVQQQMQQLNMFVDLLSTIVKSFSDSVKGVIQKSS